ncbi:hypothetical protein IAU59_004609 [Kwoniella sp. CBS 9459]
MSSTATNDDTVADTTQPESEHRHVPLSQTHSFPDSLDGETPTRVFLTPRGQQFRYVVEWGTDDVDITDMVGPLNDLVAKYTEGIQSAKDQSKSSGLRLVSRSQPSITEEEARKDRRFKTALESCRPTTPLGTVQFIETDEANVDTIKKVRCGSIGLYGNGSEREFVGRPPTIVVGAGVPKAPSLWRQWKARRTTDDAKESYVDSRIYIHPNDIAERKHEGWNRAVSVVQDFEAQMNGGTTTDWKGTLTALVDEANERAHRQDPLLHPLVMVKLDPTELDACDTLHKVPPVPKTGLEEG